jgi:hypothetical protein
MWSTHHREEPRPLRRKAHRARPPRARGFHASVAGLEARTVLSTLTVLNTLDKGAGYRPSHSVCAPRLKAS